ncbi:hypothetical protein E2562_016626 [Oryza meyeriana var. granulata]|uniref:Uncharacterized protein n=1 Tax=Oryza meyeriana var. granulata TaxID=110450 RepID=A0A6G1EKU8_9ORYZ|nr:hypothetical protein E2562_016626 [Oryza meyeriana var. granulata]
MLAADLAEMCLAHSNVSVQYVAVADSPASTIYDVSFRIQRMFGSSAQQKGGGPEEEKLIHN